MPRLSWLATAPRFDYGAIIIEDGLADRPALPGLQMRGGLPKINYRDHTSGARGVVRCSSTDKGAEVRKACGVGFIGCKNMKACEYDAIHVSDFLARIDVENASAAAPAPISAWSTALIFGIGPKAAESRSKVNIKKRRRTTAAVLWALNIGHLICEYRELF